MYWFLKTNKDDKNKITLINRFFFDNPKKMLLNRKSRNLRRRLK